MAEWRLASLRDLSDILDSRRIPVREEDRPSGSVPYYGANGQQGWIDRPLFDEPLILLAEDGGHFDDYANRSIAYRIDGPSWVNNHAHVLRATAGVDQSYLFWSLRNKDIRRWIAGGTRSKLTRGQMEQVKIPVPSLEEQRRIAEILDTIDETIQATERVIAKQAKVRAGLAASLLSGRFAGVYADECKTNETPPPPASPSNSRNLDMAEWRLASLRDLSDILDSRRIPVREEDRPSGSVPYYGANGQQGWIDRPLFDEPLILLAEDGGHFDDYANRSIAYRIDGPSWVNNHAHVLRATAGVDQSYLFWSLRNRDIRRWIAGGTRSKLTRGQMEQVKIPVPSLEEQRRIAEILDTIDESIRANQQQRDKLRQLRSGLAADLLSGRVRTVAA